MFPCHEVTQLLAHMNCGNAEAMADVMPLLYDELHKLARHHLGTERPDHTLQATALVHEAYMRLAGQQVHWQNRKHYFGIASRVMRRILVDYARSRYEEKRGGYAVKVALDDVTVTDEREKEVIDLAQARSRRDVMQPPQ